MSVMGSSKIKLRFKPGVKGEKGDTGSITPELEALRDEVEADKTAAGNSATAAAGSASAASTSATAAAGSASTASTQATNAAGSASTASTAATNAGNSATAAGTSATDAANSATAAAGSATSASGSATAAATSATNASSSATVATAAAAAATILTLAGRISLVSGIPVTGSDDAGATTLYLVPFNGNATQVYNGSNFITYAFSELTLTLTAANHLSGSTYDVFDFINAGSVLIGTGPAWSSATSRGTGGGTTEVETYLGRLVNKNAITLRNNTTTYSVAARQATLRASITCSANGQTEDSRTRRYVSNVYNAVPRLMYRTETTASWAYSTASYVIANNGNGANGLFYTHAVAGRMVKVDLLDLAANSTSTARLVYCAIGVNQTAADDSLTNTGINCGTSGVFGHSRYEGCPGIGKNAIYWLQKGAGVDTQTWVAVSGDINTGIMGWTEN